MTFLALKLATLTNLICSASLLQPILGENDKGVVRGRLNPFKKNLTPVKGMNPIPKRPRRDTPTWVSVGEPQMSHKDFLAKLKAVMQIMNQEELKKFVGNTNLRKRKQAHVQSRYVLADRLYKGLR